MLSNKEYLILPLRDTVVFPNCMTVLTVGRKTSLLNVEKAYLNNEQIFCIAQRDKSIENVTSEKELFEIGTLCEITQKITLPNGDLRIFVKGIEKARIDTLNIEDGKISCFLKPLRQIKVDDDPEELDKIRTIVINKAEVFIKAHLQGPFDVFSIFKKIENNVDIIYILTNILNIDINAKQAILEEKSTLKQFIKLNQYLEIEKSLIITEKEINEKIDKKLQEHQKNFYLKEKLRIIKQELKGSDEEIDDDDKSDVSILRKKAKKLALSQEAREKFNDEISKLESTPSFSPDYSTVKNYLETLTSLPWGKTTKLTNSLKDAEKILNEDHYGLDDVKQRILEFIAVMKNTKKTTGPILCLVGAPGVGKTSLARSIARATNREYVKVSLGGLRDEAEIRGHRKTYVGAMSGKIIQAIRKVKVDNPLILLDEIDKMNSDLRGDPTSALLEVLDPEQNKNFNDHFLEVDYDLSNVLFLATANTLQSIPYPLQDRMEIIKVNSYTEDEKLAIAKEHILKKELEKHNLTTKQFEISDNALLTIIRNYTFEAGVRNLERNIESIVRKATRKIVEDKKIKNIHITERNLKDYLGVEKYDYTEAQKQDTIGVATGMAYTEMGGDLLYLEALKFDGNGKLNITGKLGDVMKESVQAAFSYVRSKASEIGIDSKKFNKYDFHVHVPEGATPKDGPSAGVAISVALMSCLSGLKVKSDTAMTGEITLTGKVLPIGGLREKLLAALRGRIKNVLIPKKNIKDIEEIPEKVKKGLNIIPIETIEEAFKFILVGYDKLKSKKK